jgi:WD40 repeat protein
MRCPRRPPRREVLDIGDGGPRCPQCGLGHLFWWVSRQQDARGRVYQRDRASLSSPDWDLAEKHSGSVYSVAFSLDGKQVVSGSGDKTVRLWDAATGAALQTLEGHSGPVSPIAQGGNSPPTLFVSNNWVTEEGSNLVWLPPAYRPTCEAVWNKIIVLGHSSGRVSILRFKEGSKLI